MQFEHLPNFICGAQSAPRQHQTKPGYPDQPMEPERCNPGPTFSDTSLVRAPYCRSSWPVLVQAGLSSPGDTPAPPEALAPPGCGPTFGPQRRRRSPPTFHRREQRPIGEDATIISRVFGVRINFFEFFLAPQFCGESTISPPSSSPLWRGSIPEDYQINVRVIVWRGKRYGFL